MIFTFLSTSLMILSVVDVTDQKKIARIIEGIPTKPCTYHYVVSMVILWRQKSFVTAIHFCTGSLISPKWVLTAAHCLQFDPKDMNNRAVAYGAFGKDMIVKRMLKVILHPQYIDYGHEIQNDIGLALTRPIENKILGRLSIADYFSLIGRPVLYVGNGLNITDEDFDPLIIPAYMTMNLTKDLKIISERKLPRLYYRGAVVKCDPSKRFAAICVRPTCSNSNQRMQRGDSGGPLLYRERIVGVASAVADSHCLVTPVSSYVDWIIEVMSNNQTKNNNTL